MARYAAPVAFALVVAGCATLGQLGSLVRAPQFEEADNRPAEITLLGPSTMRPMGGVSVRLWTEVTNPNRFGFTLSTVRGWLHLQDVRAAVVDLPLGLPLTAGATETFPIDVAIGFADLPGLEDAIRRALARQPIDYRLEGTIGIDAGTYGTPEFGPMTLLRGTVGGQRTSFQRPETSRPRAAFSFHFAVSTPFTRSHIVNVRKATAAGTSRRGDESDGAKTQVTVRAANPRPLMVARNPMRPRTPAVLAYI
jgi:hypothetical protein